jgi:hypothetical protein
MFQPKNHGDDMVRILITEILENLAITLADYAHCKA